MRHKAFTVTVIALLFLEAAVMAVYAAAAPVGTRNAVEVNEAVQSVRADWDALPAHRNTTDLDYAVIDENGELRFATRRGLSESIHTAIVHRDTILPIQKDGSTLGHIIIYNDGPELAHRQKQRAAAFFLCMVLFQCACFALYSFWLHRNILKPFRELEHFAERVAGGNLDISLKMDRKNIFGAFTESFDIMRAELKKARLAEARANAEKKELIAKLSHDIRTPVASIRAAAEVGEALAETEKSRKNYANIVRKADQISALVDNLFSATLEELQQLKVEPVDMQSAGLAEMLQSADPLSRAQIPPIPGCMICADRLRLQQVLDNVFANSYKYAGTEIDVSISETETHLVLRIEDHGGGVPAEELPELKEKYRRGRNAKHVEGAGLGLYISDRLMCAMGGGLTVENGADGLCVSVQVALSGAI